jgi:hypothetical protein
MTYQQAPATFLAAARTALSLDPSRRTYPGVGAYLHTTVAETARQVEITRALGAGGYAIFAYANLFPSPSHESRADLAAKQLRAQLRRRIAALNGVKTPDRNRAGAAEVSAVAVPAPKR